MTGIMSLRKNAEKRNNSARQLQKRRGGDDIQGTLEFGGAWDIPEEADKPAALAEADGAAGKVDLSESHWKMLEFFAGSGLVAYGMKGRFSPVWSNDIDGRKAAVYRANFKSDHFVQADIRNITGASLPCAHLSWASFPCQDLSLAGNMKGIYAERSGLVWEWLRVMYEMKERPKILALENVTGLLSADGGANYISLHNALAERGYRCGAMEINADLFVPQSRPRIFVIAVRKDVPVPERMVSGGPNWLHNNAAQKLGNQLDGWIWWNAEKPAARKAELKDILEPDAVFDKDGALKLIPERMMKELNSRDNAVAAGYRRTRREGQRLELRFDGLAGCLRTPSGGSSKQYIVVRRNGTNHARLLTARETARLMGAPDSYSLPGSYNDAYFAMGDAVALPVANFLSEKFLMPLTEAAYHD